MTTAHNHSLVDKIISTIDNGLRSSFTRPPAHRSSPATKFANDPVQHSDSLREKSASLMRVNHVGEVCAQALYQGQALTSRSIETRNKMHTAANEEIDHLNWCHQRINELGGHTSVFNPLWYSGSFALGVCAGIAGDKWSLGFLAETERQVVEHLHSHLSMLPEEDTVSRSIVEQMAKDEAKHAQMAIDEGAADLPKPVKQLMKITAKLMTTVSEKI